MNERNKESKQKGGVNERKHERKKKSEKKNEKKNQLKRIKHKKL